MDKTELCKIQLDEKTGKYFIKKRGADVISDPNIFVSLVEKMNEGGELDRYFFKKFLKTPIFSGKKTSKQNPQIGCIIGKWMGDIKRRQKIMYSGKKKKKNTDSSEGEGEEDKKVGNVQRGVFQNGSFEDLPEDIKEMILNRERNV